jgi:hypothetical protein
MYTVEELREHRFDRIEVRPIPDDAPIVSFDVNLGKKYKRIGFDYDAFARHSDNIDFDTFEQPPLIIQVEKPTMLAKGFYNQSKVIRVNAGSHMNMALRHEMIHALDHQRGHNMNTVRKLIGSISSLFVYPASVAFGANLIAEATGPESVYRILDSTPATLGRWAILATFAWGYYFNPLERRARAGAREFAPEIIYSLERSVADSK